LIFNNGEPLMKIVMLGLSITSSWGNGHATTYRGLVRALSERGHEVLFLERDVPWYRANRDLAKPPYCRTELYNSLLDLRMRFRESIRDADVVMVGSYVPEGISVGEWVCSNAKGIKVFYDIDTPVTMSSLERGDSPYINAELAPKYDLYLSFTGGPILALIEKRYGVRMARALYCSVDPLLHYPEEKQPRWDFGYIGTYSDDRQPLLENLLCEPARRWNEGRFVVAGPLYPDEIRWPENVQRIEHLCPGEHRGFYSSQRFTLNITRAAMVTAGFSPSVRIFEAAACATPVISDYWEGLETFFEHGAEIFLTHSTEETLKYLRGVPEDERRIIGENARARVLKAHTAAHRATEFENYVKERMSI
jgi:spore maturation protein CgeB